MDYQTNSNTGEYIDLTEILKKERSERDRKRVNEICEKNSPVAEKIRLIEEVDNKSENSSYEYMADIDIDENELDLMSAEDDEAEDEILPGLVSAKKAQENRKTIKKTLKRANIFVFWFRELTKISVFAANAGGKSGLLVVRYFPPTVKLTHDFAVLWNENVYLPAVSLDPFLTHVLETEWRTFTKKEYNLISQFRQLCRKITAANLKLITDSGDNAIFKIKSLERQFLACSLRLQYRTKIIDLVKAAALKYHDSKYDVNSISSLTRVLLDKSYAKPSLTNIILAMNIIKYRQCVDMRDLIENEDDMISDYEFECTPEIREKIQDYITKRENDLMVSIEERDDLERYVNFLPLDSEKHFNYSILEFYYNKTKMHDKALFKSDCEMVPFFILNCARVFKYNFHEFLTEKVTFDDNSQLQIFDSSFFKSDFEKLELQSERLKRYHYEFKNLTTDRLRNIIHKVKPGTNSEMEMYIIIKEITRIFREIAGKLVTIMNAHYSEGQRAESLQPINLSYLEKRPISIAGYENLVKSKRLINQMKVENILKEITKYCFIVAFWIDSKDSSNPAIKKEQLAKEIDSAYKDLERMDSPEHFVAIKRKIRLA